MSKIKNFLRKTVGEHATATIQRTYRTISKPFRRMKNSNVNIADAADSWTEWEQVRVRSLGEPVYYVIRRQPPAEGFFSNYFCVLAHVRHALDNDWTPVIDMKNYHTYYSEEKPVYGTSNAWEYFFVQNPDLLTKAYGSRIYILAGQYSYPEYRGKYDLVDSDEKFKRWLYNTRPIAEKYGKVRREIIEKSLPMNERIGRNAIGLHLRGTDMRISPGHPRPVEYQRFLEVVRDLVKEFEVKTVFICTDEAELLDKCRAKLENDGLNVVCYDDNFRATGGGDTGIHKIEHAEGEHYRLGEEVLLDALALAHCDYLVAGKSNVPLGACLLRPKDYKAIRWIY